MKNHNHNSNYHKKYETDIGNQLQKVNNNKKISAPMEEEPRL
jgi:hypothetical protein